MDKRFIGSTIVIVLGSLSIVAGLATPSSTLFSGTSMVLSALAYRSAKQRKLGLVESTTNRKTLEVVGLLIMILLLVFQNDFLDLLYYEPAPYLLIPMIGLIVYIFMFLKAPSQNVSPDGLEENDTVWRCDCCDKEYQSYQSCLKHEKTHKNRS